jgi:hypothetical protein
VVLWHSGRSQPREAVFEPPSRILEAAPLCPWREPEADLPRFFPGATRQTEETRILSGRRLELIDRLGRELSPEEHALQVHRILSQDEEVGVVLTRRVRGAHGAIEIVLGVDATGAVRGVRLQRLREPSTIAELLTAPDWLAAFQGRRAADGWKVGRDLPAVSAEAQASADAIADGVRSLLVLHQAAQESATAASTGHSRG